jgi:integrase
MFDYGRSKGLTWHTIRHEFVSRNIENTGDPVVTQRLARHKDGRTTLAICMRASRASWRRSFD